MCIELLNYFLSRSTCNFYRNRKRKIFRQVLLNVCIYVSIYWYNLLEPVLIFCSALWSVEKPVEVHTLVYPTIVHLLLIFYVDLHIFATVPISTENRGFVSQTDTWLQTHKIPILIPMIQVILQDSMFLKCRSCIHKIRLL